MPEYNIEDDQTASDEPLDDSHSPAVEILSINN